MAEKSLDAQIEKWLRRYRRETVMLWVLFVMGILFVPMGVIIYSFAEILGVVIALTGAMVITFTWDRLSLTKFARKMAHFIKEKENVENVQ